MPNWPLYLALLAALAMGFWQGKRYQKKRSAVHKDHDPLGDYYFKGLNYLLNEEPDSAIDTFVKALEVNSETLETHLALGKMLRKRGEVDRAIRIHQNLLARPGLSVTHSQQAEYELAVDFVKAGLFDRAEGLLTNLIEQEGEFKQLSLRCLLDVYRDEKEWEDGLAVLQQLSGSRFSKTYDQWLSTRAHFCCELAEDTLAQGQAESARQWLKQALSYDKQHVRANLLLGQLEINRGNAKKGIQLLQKIAEQAPEFISETLEPLRQGYTNLDNLKKYHVFLSESNEKTPQAETQIALANSIFQLEDAKAAVRFLAEQIQKTPSAKGLNTLLSYYIEFTSGQTQQDLEALQQVFQQVSKNTADYQCRHCGFEARSLHWLCPSCKTWGEVKSKNSL